MAKIVFISAHDDVHLPFVSKHLDVDDEVIRIDPIGILKGDSLDYEFKDQRMTVYYRGHPLTDVSGVWYRRPSPYTTNDIPVVEEEKAYAFSAMNQQVRALNYLLQEALWISKVDAIRKANSKPLQQVVASQLGFNIPDTLYATDPKRAEEFVRQEKTAIAKTPATAFPTSKLAFSKVVRPEDGLDYRGVRMDPFIFQALIKPANELRITVVGSQVFAATVGGLEAYGGSSEFRDWRYGHVDGGFTAKAYDLPQKLNKQCVALVRKLGLEFGAIDIILDEQGKYWFLEINPNGQWGFIEEKTGQPIGKAIAENLKAGKKASLLS
jgi:glutathione synthase/RimK-type ligase-like ATP-grasp enzyme